MKTLFKSLGLVVSVMLLANCGGRSSPETKTGGLPPFPVILSSVPVEHAKIGVPWVYNYRVDTDPPGGYVSASFNIAQGVQGVMFDSIGKTITFMPSAGITTGLQVNIGELLAVSPSGNQIQSVNVIIDP